MNNAAKPRGRLPRRAFMAAAWLAALGLAACGPGVGGSGTGREEGQGAAAPPSPSPPIGPAVLRFADEGDGGRVQATLEGERLRVLAPCLSIDFDGLRSSGSRYDGRLAADATRTVGAEVELVGNTLLLTLRLGTGEVLLGPLALLRNDQPPPLAPCG